MRLPQDRILHIDTELVGDELAGNEVRVVAEWQGELVRCKDCRWWSGSVTASHNNHLCKRALDQNVDYWTRGDDYCSYGERREDGEA